MEDHSSHRNIREHKHVFETRTATGSELFFLLTCLHNHIYIVKCLDPKFKNLGETAILACEIFTSGCRLPLKFAHLSSLLGLSGVGGWEGGS